MFCRFARTGRTDGRTNGRAYVFGVYFARERAPHIKRNIRINIERIWPVCARWNVVQLLTKMFGAHDAARNRLWLRVYVC